MLLYAGANVQATTRLGGYTPLLMASKAATRAMIEALLTAGADAERGNDERHDAADVRGRVRQRRRGQSLLDHGADVNAKRSARGETALMFAAAYGRADAIRVLTAHGADVKATTKVVDLARSPRKSRSASRIAATAARDPANGGAGGAGAAGAAAGAPHGAGSRRKSAA